MNGNVHVQFLGGWSAVMRSGYPMQTLYYHGELCNLGGQYPFRMMICKVGYNNSMGYVFGGYLAKTVMRGEKSGTGPRV
jgi:hypothetical protein